MRAGPWFGWLKWPLALGVLVGSLAGAYFLNGKMQAQRKAPGSGESVRAPKRAKGGVVMLDPETVEEHGIRDEPAQGLEWSEPMTVYGRLVPNPNTTAVVQAPFAGVLQADAKLPWPTVGAPVRAGQVLGQIALRVGPQEKLDLQLKRKEARLKVQGAEKVVAIQRQRLDRLEKSSTGGQIVSQRELDDARVSLTEADTNLGAAQAAAELWQGALDAIEQRDGGGGSTYSLPFKAPADGEIVETAARPGMAVEAGAVLVRLVDFRRLLAQMDLPAEVVAAGPPEQIELAMPAASAGRAMRSSPRLPARSIGPAPQVDLSSQFTSYWYEATINADSKASFPPAWRPGRFVTALLRLPDALKQPAVAVPATALLAHEGRFLVYVKLAPGKYNRREVRLLGQDRERTILAGGVRPGEAVVVQQAQVLLSEEFRGRGEDD